MSDEFTLNLSETARQKLSDFLEAEERTEEAIRVIARRFGRRFEYDMDLVGSAGPDADDIVVEHEGIKLAVDPESAVHLDGTTIDYTEGLRGAGFRFENPNAVKPLGEPGSVEGRIQEILDTEINPAIASHGGTIMLLEFKEGTAYVEMSGGCQGCCMAPVTLSQGVETRIRELVPEVERILDTTNHAGGTNPYYRPSP